MAVERNGLPRLDPVKFCDRDFALRMFVPLRSQLIYIFILIGTLIKRSQCPLARACVQKWEVIMKVKEAMHKGVQWMEATASLIELARVMKEHDIGAIPIGEPYLL
jgi:hypothetical protein